MNGGQTLALVYFAMALVIVGSALMIRWRDRGRMLRMLVTWIVIFAAAYLVSRHFGF